MSPIPDRPAAGEDIASEWGGEIHDRVFAPKGTRVSGGVATAATWPDYRTLHLDTGVDDPGGWLDAPGDKLEVPADAQGIYVCTWAVDAEGAPDTSETRVYVHLNGSSVANVTEGNEGATRVSVAGTVLLDLVAGDELQLVARQPTAGAHASLTVRSLALIRIGDALGA